VREETKKSLFGSLGKFKIVAGGLLGGGFIHDPFWGEEFHFVRGVKRLR